MRRRTFLTALAATAVAPPTLMTDGRNDVMKATFTLAKPEHLTMVHIWGDGIHDDAPAIQALLDMAAAAGGGPITIERGTYSLLARIRFTDCKGLGGPGG